jgi:hypothetical protein
MPKLRTVVTAGATEAAGALVEIPAVDSAEAALTSVVDLQADLVEADLVVDLREDSAGDHRADLVDLRVDSAVLVAGDLRVEVVQ